MSRFVVLYAVILAALVGYGVRAVDAAHKPRAHHSEAFYRQALAGQVRAKRAAQRTVVRLRRELAAYRQPEGSGDWQDARVTSYATFEPGLSRYTACPSPYGTLDDEGGYTVAVHYGIGLDGAGGLPACGARIVLSDGRVSHAATVTDRTLSSYTFELSNVLSRVFGAPAQFSGTLTWSGYLRWRRA